MKIVGAATTDGSTIITCDLVLFSAKPSQLSKRLTVLRFLIGRDESHPYI